MTNIGLAFTQLSLTVLYYYLSNNWLDYNNKVQTLVIYKIIYSDYTTYLIFAIFLAILIKKIIYRNKTT
ncbi:hypothetical protein [uncultured Gammaproteobacteria bacterium]|nr:hypothetical protein [uncultured Gammaproteobacteria bacterium]